MPRIRDERRCDTVDPRIEYADPPVPRERTLGISEWAFADGNADRRIESAEIDIPARHPRVANADQVAICLPDAYADGGKERRGRHANELRNRDTRET